MGTERARSIGSIFATTGAIPSLTPQIRISQLAFLGEAADPTQHSHGIAVEKAHGSRPRAQQSEQMLDERRRAGAVRADQPADAPLRDVEVHAIEREPAAERARQIVDVDEHVFHRYLSPFAAAAASRGIAARRSRSTRRMSSAVKFNWCASARSASTRCSMMRCRSRFASGAVKSETYVPAPRRLWIRPADSSSSYAFTTVLGVTFSWSARVRIGGSSSSGRSCPDAIRYLI